MTIIYLCVIVNVYDFELLKNAGKGLDFFNPFYFGGEREVKVN